MSSSDKTDEAELTLAREWKRFAESTSIKIVPKALRSKTGCLRFVWLIALLLGIGVASYQSYIIISTYLQYKTSLNIAELNEAPPFPDITICKMNPPPTFESSDVTSLINHVDREVDQYDRLDNDYWMDEGNKDTLSIVDDLGSLTGYFQTINSSQIQLRNVTEFIIQCSFTTWNSVRHNCTLGTDTGSWFLTPEYPTCITLQPNETLRNYILGFSGIFYMDDFETLSAPTFETSLLNSQAKGVKVFLSEPGTSPNLLQGAPVSAGTQGNFHVSSHRIQRLDEPYGSCKDGHNYSKTVCENTCKQDYMLAKCQCLDPDTPTTLEMRNQHVYCGALEENGKNISKTLSRMNCKKNKLAELHENCRITCPSSCKEYSFTYQKFDASWPHESRHLSFYRDQIRPREFLSSNFDWYYEDTLELLNTGSPDEAFKKLRSTDLITRNFLQINIHFDDAKVTLFKDTPLMTVASLFGQLGGILNLWIGITFVTIVEFGEFLYHASVVIAYKAKVSTNQVRSFADDTNDAEKKSDIFTNNERTDFGHGTVNAAHM